MLTRRWMQTQPPDRHSLAWRIANIALFVFALVGAAAVMVGMWLGILLLASHGN